MTRDSVRTAVAYCRVSSEEQAREGVSLAAQEARLTAYCAAKGWTLVAVVRDEGESAKSLDRPGLAELLTALPKRGRPWDAVVFLKVDRLTRSVRDLGELVTRFDKAKAALVCVEEPLDTSTAAGRMLANLLVTVAQWEREANGERTKTALGHLRTQGRRVSRFAPYGARFEGGQLTPDPAEQAVRARVRALAATGLGPSALVRATWAEGLRNRHGHVFSRAALAQMVATKRKEA